MNSSLRLLPLALFASGTLGLTGCKKDPPPAPDNRSQREKWLTAPGWNLQRIDDVVTTPTGITTTTSSSPSAFFPACNLDDLQHYNTNRTFTVDDGPLKCQPPAPPSTNTWEFGANETEIIYNGAAKGSTITTLNATTLALTYSDTYPDGTKWVQTVTYAAR